MRKRNNIFGSIAPVLIVFALYMVFYDKITSKPSDAGFWLILALGMSLGAAITKLLHNSKNKN